MRYSSPSCDSPGRHCRRRCCHCRCRPSVSGAARGSRPCRTRACAASSSRVACGPGRNRTRTLGSPVTRWVRRGRCYRRNTCYVRIWSIPSPRTLFRDRSCGWRGAERVWQLGLGLVMLFEARDVVVGVVGRMVMMMMTMMRMVRSWRSWRSERRTTADEDSGPRKTARLLHPHHCLRCCHGSPHVTIRPLTLSLDEETRMTCRS